MTLKQLQQASVDLLHSNADAEGCGQSQVIVLSFLCAMQTRIDNDRGEINMRAAQHRQQAHS